MSEANAQEFEGRQCIAKDLDHVLAAQIQEGKIAAAQKLFNDCIPARALDTVLQQQQKMASNHLSDSSDSKSGEKSDQDERHRGGLPAIRAMWQAPQATSQTIDVLREEVRNVLLDNNFAHPEYADMLTGVAIEDK